MNSLKVLLAAFALACALGPHAHAAAPPRPAPQGDDADELLRACFTLSEQQQFEEALASCTKAARLRPKDFRPHAIAGYAHLVLMEFQSASESLAKAIKLQPRDKQLYFFKATADYWRNAKSEALAACRKALELDPNYAEAHALLGDMLKDDKKRWGEAAAAYRAALKADPRFLPAYAGLGEVLALSKDEKGAEEVFRQGLAADPKRMAGRFELGRLLVRQGRLAEARELWEGRTSGEDRTIPNFITLLERAENLKRATEALAKKPDDPEALVAMGLAVMDGDSWVMDERQERAVVYFRKALAIRPGYAPAQYAICKAYIQLADVYEDKKRVVDEELAKLRRLDPKLAAELEEYRKNYSGGLQVPAPVKVDK